MALTVQHNVWHVLSREPNHVFPLAIIFRSIIIDLFLGKMPTIIIAAIKHDRYIERCRSRDGVLSNSTETERWWLMQHFRQINLIPLHWKRKRQRQPQYNPLCMYCNNVVTGLKYDWLIRHWTRKSWPNLPLELPQCLGILTLISFKTHRFTIRRFFIIYNWCLTLFIARVITNCVQVMDIHRYRETAKKWKDVK